MNLFERLRATLRRRAGDRLSTNLGWYGLAELGVRVASLVTAIVLARVLVPQDFGIAAAALIAFELVRTLSRNGIGQMIVRATPETVDAASASAYRISWCVSLVLIAIQLAVGAWLAQLMDRPEVLHMLATLAASYLLLPFSEVQYARLMRANRMKRLAGISGTQVICDCLLSATLAIGGLGAWAVVLPKLLTAPLYTMLLRHAEPWSTSRGQAGLPLQEVVAFSLPVLGAELLATARGNIDKVMVGAILGVEALGIYTFAINAGLGFSLTLTNAVTATLYPHLAELAHAKDAMLARFDAAVRENVVPVSAILCVQTLAALMYVPIVFGDRWAFAAALVSLCCLSAVAKPAFDAARCLLRAAGRPHLELAASGVFTLVLLGGFALALQYGLELGILIFALVSVVGHLAFAAWARHVIGRRPRVEKTNASARFPAQSSIITPA